jgi:hypothetical protein
VTSTMYHGCAIIDHTTRSLAPEMAMLVTDGRVGWLGPAEEAPDPGPGGEFVDAGGTTAVAGMVDAHSHLTLPGGSHWIDRAGDPTDRLLATAEDNARLLRQAGVRWARDVGAPVRDGGRLLGEPGAGVLAQGGPGRLPARPRRPPHRPGIAVAGVAHQLATLTHSALATTSSHLPIRRQAAPPMFLARCRAGGRDRDRTCDFCRVKTSPPATRPNRDRPPTPQRRR